MTYFVKLPSGKIVNLDLVVVVDPEGARIAMPEWSTAEHGTGARFTGLAQVHLSVADRDALYQHVSDIALVARDPAKDAPRDAPRRAT